MTDPIHSSEPQVVETPRKPGRSKRVLASAALVAAGVVGGGGATYAIASQVDPTAPGGTSSVQPGGPNGGFRGNHQGAPPDGTAPQGTAPDGSAPTTDPSAAPSTTTG